MKSANLYIWFQLAVGICNRLTKEVCSEFQSIEDIYTCDDFSFLGKKREKYIEKLENKDVSQAFEIMKICEAKSIRVTGYYDQRYPDALRKIDTPPAVLYSIGNFIDINKVPCIAIVGTRKMTDYGKEITENIAYNCVKSGAVVVSGLAKGIDVCAHRGAIKGGGFTIAVLGNPIDEIYPKENEKAFKTLYDKGLVISEHYPKSPRTKADFPNRNRIISAISDAVVVTEAGEHSGALITANHAINQGVPVYAVPSAVGGENVGTNQLIKNGYPAITEANDVLSSLNLKYPEYLSIYEPSVTSKLRSYGNVITPTKKQVKKEEPKKQNKEEIIKIEPEIENKFATGSNSDRIISALRGCEILTADEICAKTGLPVSEVLIELTMMEIDGTVVTTAGGRYSLAK